MRRAERRRIERLVPPRFQGRAGHTRLLDSLTLRVSVSGIRGKSGLTALAAESLQRRGLSVYSKQTGTVPVSTKDGVGHPIQRDPRRKALLEENLWEVKRHWPMDAIVLENQAITPYTMRVFNEIHCRPHYLLVTNIRRDHLGDLARSPRLMALAFARSAPPGCTLVSGESDPALQETLRRECRRLGVRFLDAAPGRLVVPGFECLTVLDAMLFDWMGEGLTKGEKLAALRDLEAHFQWQPSSIPGVRWFHGAEINDVDSTRIVLNYLQRRERLPTTFVAYFRPDRVDRTATFAPFLRELLEEDPRARVVLCGHRSRAVARHLRRHRGRVLTLPDDPATVPRLLEHLRQAAAGGAVMTVANAVPPWPQAVAAALAPAGHPEPAPRTGDLPIEWPPLVAFEERRAAPHAPGALRPAAIARLARLTRTRGGAAHTRR